MADHEEGALTGSSGQEWVRRGRALESANRIGDAIEAYLRGGANDEAARMLSHMGYFVEAGHALMLGLPELPVEVAALNALQRHAALNAALCFARGGAAREAVGLLISLGERRRAASLLELAGRRGDAVRVMRGENPRGSPWPEGKVFRLRNLDELFSSSPQAAPTDEWEVPAGTPDGASDTNLGAEMGGRRESPASLGQPRTVTSPSARRPAAPSSIPGIPPPRRQPDGGLGRAVEVLSMVWASNPAPTAALRFLGTWVERGREEGAVRAIRAARYAIGRLLERHGMAPEASAAYASAPGILDVDDRIANTVEGRVEAADGRWLRPKELAQSSTSVAPLPTLEKLLTPPSRPRHRPVVSLGSREVDLLDDTQEGPPASPRSAPSPPPVLGRESGVPSPATRGRWMATTEAAPGDRGSLQLGLKRGDLIGDRYIIEELLGSGGMACVFKVHDTELEESVALKLFTQLTKGGTGLERFRQEMKLSRLLKHDNIIQTLEFGVWNGARYLTMELLHGRDLEQLLNEFEGRRLPISDALQLAIQACDGLIAAHDIGVIHRDIKPQNLYVVEEGRRLKLMDFGIAKLLGGSSLSMTGVRIGTPRYMSPEQIQGGAPVGPSADHYALGGVLYETLVGAPPFLDEELMPLLLNQMTAIPTPPSDQRAEVPANVDEIVRRLLEKDPADRFASSRDVRLALLQAWIAIQEGSGS